MMYYYSVFLDGQILGVRFQRFYFVEVFVKVKGVGGGVGGGGSGRGLMGQIILIYGFGIFLYILYILFKVSEIILYV